VDSFRQRRVDLSPRQVDDEDRFDRAGRGSRPRSRNRPQYDDTIAARVVTIDRGRYGCLLADDRTITAVRARELGRRAVVVGDSVGLVGDISGGADNLARIIRIEARRSVLRRTADDTDPVERVIVANAEQMVVVAASTNPPPQPRLVDRCLVAACDANIEGVLLVTKLDLAPVDDLLALYRDVPLPVITSGAGKSTLVNALVPDATQRVGVVSTATGKGMHTTTAAIALPLPGGGWVVDTPGVRSFGLAHVSRDRLVRCFPDLMPGTDECPTDCDHLDPEVCCLDAYVAAGHAHPERLDSLRRLLVSRAAD
jgi:ribosome biogenesis GTPase / thiamine phosphate phosphatase